MLIGRFTHKVDDKGRLSLPAKFRKELGETVVITHGLDQCLFVYTADEWQKFASQIGSLSMGQADTRAFSRFLLSGAIETEVDKSGRVLIPNFLREYAGLDDQVVVAGVHSRLELWNEARWEAYAKELSTKADVLAEKLGEIGMV
jgi:MraZ protein